MDWLATGIATVGAVAAVGAWLAAWYPNRFQQSWVIEPMVNPTQFLVRNNTHRRAEILSIEPTPLYPDRPNEPPTYATDEPANATIEPGEAFGIRVSRARGIRITWRRRVWWARKPREYSREWTIPIKYA